MSRARGTQGRARSRTGRNELVHVSGSEAFRLSSLVLCHLADRPRRQRAPGVRCGTAGARESPAHRKCWRGPDRRDLTDQPVDRIVHRVGISVGAERDARIQLPSELADQTRLRSPAAVITRTQGRWGVRMRGCSGAVRSRLIGIARSPDHGPCDGCSDERRRAETECGPPLNPQTPTSSSVTDSSAFQGARSDEPPEGAGPGPVAPPGLLPPPPSDPASPGGALGRSQSLTGA